MRVLIGIAVVVATTTGCPPKAHYDYKSQVDEILANSSPDIRDAPIVDIHIHTFNARYLPLQGIALGKRDASLFTLLINDRTAKGLTRAVVESTPPVPDPPGLVAEESASDSEDPDEGPSDIDDALEKYSKAYDERLAQRLPQEELEDPTQEIDHRQTAEVRIKAGEEAAEELEDQLKQIRRALKLFGFILDSDTVKKFVTTLTSHDEDQHYRFHQSFDDRVDLAVSHMMDLAPVYAQFEGKRRGPKKSIRLLPFGRQIERMSEIQEWSDSDLLFFVAYNPFRDDWPRHGEQQPVPALHIVQHAIEYSGAYGVKVYPPSGYRPIGNKIPLRPYTPFTTYPADQWDARYTDRDGDPIEACDLDRRLRELLLWCEFNRIPVFAHCNTGEFQARRKYGVRMAHPKFWQQYLESRSRELGRPCPLILCLAHAGGTAYWFGEGEHADWGEIVFGLCTDYPNVYCEFGALEEAYDPKHREFFIQRIADCIAESEARIQLESPSESGIRGRSFADKIMYGSDWFMPTSVEAVQYLSAYQLAFLDPRLQPYYRRFFFENSLRYLDAERRLHDEKYPVSPAVRSRLETLLKQRIPTPAQ